MAKIRQALSKIAPSFTIGRVGLLLLLAALPGIWIWYAQTYGNHPVGGILLQSYVEFTWEMVSIAFTILIIDRLYHQQDVRREKAQLIRQLRSSDAHDASGQLGTKGWLADGTLRQANLEGMKLKKAHWCQVDLRNGRLHHADFQGADLSEGKFKGAQLDNVKLSFANLSNTDLSDAQLATASRLAHAIMPNGERYNGRFHLPGDLQDAHAAGFNLKDSVSMCRFYDIPLEQYQN